MKTLKRGIFVVLEGIDGSGKTTAMTEVARRLREEGYDVVETGIGGDPFSLAILDVLKADLSASTDASTQSLLINAIRRHNLLTVVKPALERGAIVLCDRFILSTRYYQRECKMITALHEEFCSDVVPDMTLVLNLTPEEANARLAKRGVTDRFDRASIETKREYQKIILDWLHEHRRTAVGICAASSMKVVADRIQHEVYRCIEQQLV